MRALLAGLFVFVMLLLAASFIGSHSKGEDFPWWGGPLIGATMIGSIAAAWVVFNKPDKRGYLSGDEYVAQLRAKDLLASQTLRGRRAFEVAEFEDEGSHFFLELEDGGVLFLTGQYLYDYRGSTKDAQGNATIPFPCTELTVLRHKETNHVVDILCGGKPLPIECEAPPFDHKDFKLNRVPQDGEVIRDRSYEQLKKERIEQKRT